MLWLVLSSTIVKSKKLRGILIGLRIVSLILFFAILLDPVKLIPKGDHTSRTENYFLVDTSLSMSVENPPRLAQALDLIQPAMTNTTLKKHSHLYNFDINLGKKELLGKEKDFVTLVANGSQTRIGAALTQASYRLKDGNIANIILCTDGRDLDANSDAVNDAIRRAKDEGIPISVIPVGSKIPQFNLSVFECDAPRRVQPNQPVDVSVTVNGTSTTSQKTRVVIRAPGKKDKNGYTLPGKIVAKKDIIAADGSKPHTLTFDPENVSGIYTVEIEPYRVYNKKGELVESELTYKDNSCKIKISVEDPKIKVLYMEGTIEKYREKASEKKKKHMAWAIFKRALEKDGKIEVDTHYVTEQKARGGKLVRAKDKKINALPKTKEELFKYDVVIVSDINKDLMLKANPKFLEWVRELVEKRGGGFVMIGGRTAFGSGFWQKTVWEKMIPMQMELKNNYNQGKSWHPFKPMLMPNALSHPIMKLSADPKKNKEIFKLHPPFKGTNIIMRAKPAATVLMTHNQLALDGKWAPYNRYDPNLKRYVRSTKDGKNMMPIIAVQDFGRGRSMAFTPDAAGGWGEYYMCKWGPGNKNNQYYAKFWRNAVNWLAARSIAKHGSRVEGSTEILTYKPGEKMKVRAVVFDAKDEENIQDSIEIRAWLLDKTKLNSDSNAVLKKSILRYNSADKNFAGEIELPATITADEAIIVFEATKAGDVGKNVKLIGEDRVPVRILQIGDELKNPTPDFKNMERIVTETGGKMINTKKELKKFLVDTQNRQQDKGEFYKVPLWDKKWVFGLIILLLTVEWVIRKRVVMG